MGYDPTLDTVRAESRSGDEQSVLAAAERHFHKDIRRLQQNWKNVQTLPTGDTDLMIKAKEAEEMAEGYRTALDALRSRYEAEKAAVRRTFKEGRTDTTADPEDPVPTATQPRSSTVGHNRPAGTHRVVPKCRSRL
jgi:phosphoenolpyruvate carboxylase